MLLTRANLPDTIADIAALDELLCRPSQPLIDDLAKVDGDVMILGVAGKMGPTLAGLAKAALPHRRIIGVARFSDAGAKAWLEARGIETLNWYRVVCAIGFYDRVIAGSNVVESRRVATLRFPDIVKGLIEKAQSAPRFLVGNGSDGCPLGRTSASTAKEIKASRDSRNIQVSQHTVKNRSVVCHVRNAALASPGFTGSA